MAARLVLRICFRLNNHAPSQLANVLAFHQQVADQPGCNLLGGAGEETWREVPGERGGYGRAGVSACPADKRWRDGR